MGGRKKLFGGHDYGIEYAFHQDKNTSYRFFVHNANGRKLSGIQPGWSQGGGPTQVLGLSGGLSKSCRK